ncbi:MAG: phosphatase PAP2 family protein [Flavobacteriales bacterium]|nr:phosphatase PAP2 family protein [Flavobacteriales bacterium]
MLNSIIKWDQEVFLLLNGAGSEMYDAFWIFVSSTKSAIPLFLLIIFLLFKKHGTSFWQGLVLILVVVSLADLSSVHCFKNVFMRLRPSHDPELADQIRLLVSKGGLYGFVSSHAANFFALATISSILLSNCKPVLLPFPILGQYFIVKINIVTYLPYILFSWATLVAYSRIYVGKHYLLDVIGGALLGFVVAKEIWHLVKKIKEKYTLAL